MTTMMLWQLIKHLGDIMVSSWLTVLLAVIDLIIFIASIVEGNFSRAVYWLGVVILQFGIIIGLK